MLQINLFKSILQHVALKWFNLHNKANIMMVLSSKESFQSQLYPVDNCNCAQNWHGNDNVT